MAVHALSGQITVDQSYTMEEYVNDILLGTGITATNIQYTGHEMQIGFLEGAAGTIVPMDAGLVLSSADAFNMDASVDGFTVFEQNVPFGEGVFGEPDLLSTANSVPPLIGENFTVGSVEDVCILEFDFVATGDTMSFNYIFGSDEYLTFVNTQYNDIFAFFLSGPGITGPYASPPGFPDGAVNIAQVPDSDPPLPITISSVNDVLNQEYYIDNQTGTDITLNGFTTKLTAWSEVVCGETYHIKLAIADGSDTALESVVILESGSFSSNAVVEVDLSIDVGGPDANTIYEDCGEAVLTFTRPVETILEVEEMVIIDYAGSLAENGIDHTLLPDTVFFPPFVQTVSFPISATEDGVLEGTENVVMEILNVAACGGTGLTTFFEFFITDEPEPLIVDGYTVDVCLGEELEIEPEVSGGYGNYVYEWDTGEDTASINVEPDASTTYNVMVSDTCGLAGDEANIVINVAEFPPFEVTIDNGDLTLSCPDFASVTATATGGDGAYTGWLWTDEDGNNLFGFGNSLFYDTFWAASQIIVSVVDGCGLEATDTIDVFFNEPPPVIDLEDFLEVNCLESFTLSPTVTEGIAPYNYTWSMEGADVGFGQTFSSVLTTPTVITLEVEDNCGQEAFHDVEISVLGPPVLVTLDESVVGSCTETFSILPEVSGGTGGYVYQWLDEAGNVIGTDVPLTYTAMADETVTLVVLDECTQSASDDILIDIENLPVIVDLGEGISASCIDNTELLAEVLQGAGNYTYNWVVDGNVEATGPEDTFTWQTYVTQMVNVQVVDFCGEIGTDSVLITIPTFPLSIQTSEDADVCLGDPTTLDAEAFGGEGGFTYEWPQIGQVGQTVTLTPQSSGDIVVQATDICGYMVEGSISIDVQDITSLFQVEYLTETEVQFEATPTPECGEGECEFFWDFGDGNTSTEMNPIHEYDGLDNYVANLTVVNAIGCRDSVYMLIDAPISLFVPNAFTPNNDGINDVFQVYGAGIEDFEMIIYDRWGEVVFRSTDMDTVWIGDNDRNGSHYVPDGVYNWLVKIRGTDSEAYERRGTVMITR